MIVVAGNIYEKFQASLRHMAELETQRNTAEQRAAIEAEQQKIETLNSSCGCRARNFSRCSRP